MVDLTGQALAWMDGTIIPMAEAKIPVNDWGFIHSDATYDVVPVWQGAFFRLNDYIARFQQSCAALRLEIGPDDAQLAQILHELVAASGLREAYVAMVATRGVPLIPGTRDPRACENRFFAWCVPYIHVIKPEVMARGARLRIAQSVRRIPDGSVDARIKNYHWGDFTAGLFEAYDHGFDSVVLCDFADQLTEGPGFNFFVVRNGEIFTPNRHCLFGITRRTVIEIAQIEGVRVHEGEVPRALVYDADEVFISTSGGGPVWIAQVDNRIFGNGVEGPVTQLIRQNYWKYLAENHEFRDPINYTA